VLQGMCAQGGDLHQEPGRGIGMFMVARRTRAQGMHGGCVHKAVIVSGAR